MKTLREVFWSLVFLADRGEDEAGLHILAALAAIALLVWLLLRSGG